MKLISAVFLSFSNKNAIILSHRSERRRECGPDLLDTDEMRIEIFGKP